MSTTQTLVKERPILFSGAMVRALLDGSKTQTRRIIKPQPTQPRQAGYILHATDKSREGGFQWSDADCKNLSEPVHCPYGKPGDRLWVRETLFWSTCDEDWCYQADNCQVWADKALDYTAPILMKPKPAIPSIHMPREASRLLLEVVSVRVERLKGISEADAKAEGYSFRGFYELLNEADQEGFDLLNEDHDEFAARKAFSYPYEWYRMLWQEINGDDSWHANPWVWVVEFKSIEPTA